MADGTDNDPLAEAKAYLDEDDRLLAESRPLVCEECGKTSEGGVRGWRALLTTDDQVAIYCPDCAREEFGQDG